MFWGRKEFYLSFMLGKSMEDIVIERLGVGLFGWI